MLKNIFNKLNLKPETVLIPFGLLMFLTFIYGSIPASTETTSKTSSNITKQSETKEKTALICDGINVTEDCEIDGVEYSTYIYYPAVKEVSHYETKTTYVQEVVGHCTLCNDGTRSPSCSVGSGTCSHHGGVAEWDAPVYENVPKYEEVKVIDTQASPERYEKVLK